jgi:hypothetical protein
MGERIKLLDLKIKRRENKGTQYTLPTQLKKLSSLHPLLFIGTGGWRSIMGHNYFPIIKCTYITLTTRNLSLRYLN